MRRQTTNTRGKMTKRQQYGEMPPRCGLFVRMVDENGQPMPIPPAAPIEADGLEMYGVPVDADGRGLSLLEMGLSGDDVYPVVPNDEAA